MIQVKISNSSIESSLAYDGKVLFHFDLNGKLVGFDLFNANSKLTKELKIGRAPNQDVKIFNAKELEEKLERENEIHKLVCANEHSSLFDDDMSRSYLQTMRIR